MGNIMGSKLIQEFKYVAWAPCNSDDADLSFEDTCFGLVKCKKCGLVSVNSMRARL